MWGKMMQIKLIQGDITKHPVDVIVNSANKSLMRGGGVCGAIHKVAGVELEKECLALKQSLGFNWLPVGQTVVTKAHNLPASYVIHTVGPKVTQDDVSLLFHCYMNSILEAEKLQASSISFPPISTGIYGLPLEESAKYVGQALEQLPQLEFVKEINLLFLKQEDVEKYGELLKK